MENYQGVAMMNYSETSIPFTRIVEHKHFTNVKSSVTIITKEAPAVWFKNKEPYYPINDAINNNLYEKYKELSLRESNIIFGGRLAEYKYYDMHQVIGSAMHKYSLMAD
jgi:UDP-galactopyranose mutase